MPVKFDRDADPGLIRLEGEVDISQAADLKQILLEALAKQGGVRISLEAVTGMDVTAVQLLWAAAEQAKARGAVLALKGTVAESLRGALCETGFDSLSWMERTEPSSEVQ